MKREQLSFRYLKDYAGFLIENCLDELTKTDIKRSQDLELPLLKLLAHIGEKELFELSKKGILDYLNSIVEGTAVDAVLASNADWKSNQGIVPREQVVASDIALIYNIRKHSLRHFLPRYTSDINLIINILDEIDDYYTFQEELAIQTYKEINEEAIRQNEARLKETQDLASIGYWEYDLENNLVNWSEELYKIYGLNSAHGITSDVIGQHIFKEDISFLHEKVRSIYEKGGSFTHEYRIRLEDGSVKYLLDKGYIDKDSSGKILVKGISQDITSQKRTEGKLLEHEHFMQNMAEVAPYIISVFDVVENKVIYVNKDTSEILGYSDTELKNKGLSIVDLIFHPEDAPKVGELIEKVKRCGDQEIEELEYRVKDSRNNWKWLSSRVSPFKRDQMGNVTQILSIIADINEKKAAIEEIKRNEKLLNEAQAISHLGSWEWDTTTNIVKWSDEMYRLFGYLPGETEMTYELYLSHLYPDEKELTVNAIYKCFTDGMPYELENRIIRKDGQVRWLSCKGQVSNQEEGRILKLAGIAMDVTDQKKYADALQQQTEALIASNKELEAFCYTISHDLRSPLRAIDGFGRKLAISYGETLDKEGQRLLSIVRTNAQQMGVLIDSLLEFSRLNRKELKKSFVPMQELVNKVITSVKEQVPDTRAEFKISGLLDASGDSQLITQVWSNLISNAVKFSSKKERPLIEIGSEKKGRQVVYFVKDNGAGFDMEYRDKLFGVFQRLHSEEEFNGTGVGLATVQRIIHRHGGKVWAEGELDKGAVFYFSLYQNQEVPQQAFSLN